MKQRNRRRWHRLPERTGIPEDDVARMMLHATNPTKIKNGVWYFLADLKDIIMRLKKIKNERGYKKY